MGKNKITRNNHYVAQMYLRAWRNENNLIWTYNLLVPSDRVYTWREESTRSISKAYDFYTTIEDGKEIDKLEKVFGARYEAPAGIPMKKAIRGEELTKEEFEKIIDYVGAQIFRTLAYMEKHKLSNINQINKEINKILGIKNNSGTERELNDRVLRLINEVSEGNGIEEAYEITLGKAYNIFRLRNILRTLDKIRAYDWKIVDVDPEVYLPTSDDPVILLNYGNQNNYDFKGKIDHVGTQIIMPLSPNKIIYTRVGKINKAPDILTKKQSEFIKKLIIEHAYRQIYSIVPDNEITSLRKVKIDRIEYVREIERRKTIIRNYRRVIRLIDDNKTIEENVEK